MTHAGARWIIAAVLLLRGCAGAPVFAADNLPYPVQLKKGGNVAISDLTATDRGSANPRAYVATDRVLTTGTIASDGLLTTMTVRTVAGHPLRVTSATLNYVDIGTTGGTFSTWERLDIDARAANVVQDYGEMAFDEFPPNPAKPQNPYHIYAPINVNTGWYDDPIDGPVDASSYQYPDSMLRIYQDGVDFDSSEPGLWFDFTQTGMRFGPAGASSYGADMDILGNATASGFFTDNSSYTDSAIVASNVEAGVNVLAYRTVRANDDLHGYDAVYAGDPQGLNPLGPSIGHLRTYGNLVIDPRGAVSGALTSVRYGTTGTLYLCTTGLSTDNLGRQYTDTNGYYFDLFAGAVGGFPTQSPSKRQFVFKWPTYIEGQLGATGDIYTSGTVNAGNDVAVGDDLTVTGDTATATLDITSAAKSGTDTIPDGLATANITGTWATTAVIICTWGAGNPWVDGLPENAGQLTAVVTGSGTATVNANYPLGAPSGDCIFNWRVID